VYEFSEFKVLHHLDRVRDILAGGNPPPVTFEIDPTNRCNHSCVWCIDGRFNRRHPDSLAMPVLERFLGDIARAGVKSVVVKGGGEPLCYPEVDRLLEGARGEGLEVGLITNGELLLEHAEAIVRTCSWVRVSINGACAETHEAIHRPERPGAFERTVAGMEALSPRVFLGVVFVTARVNAHEVYEAARLAKRVGARYISLKLVCTSAAPGVEDASWIGAAGSLYHLAYRELHEAKFMVFGSAGPKGDLVNLKPIPYDRCEGPQLVGILCADGRLYPCCSTRMSKDHCFGSVAESSFLDVWNGARRREVLEKIRTRDCRNLCLGKTSYLRYDHYNRLFQYLASQQAGHVDFL
jgi:MoaA/NifB/PqqE/SkfB family radical SAM enzyme